MTIAVEDPLIAKMDIERVLPVHESCRRLRGLYPDSPRAYGVAVLADVPRRQWWPMSTKRTADRLWVMYAHAAAEVGPRIAGRQLAASLIHEVVGRMLPMVLLEGRAWDADLRNLWIHIDRDGVIDWAAIVDPTLRVLPDDPAITRHSDAVIALPSESALTTWVAHRCHWTLLPLFVGVHDVCDGAVSIDAMWRIAGSAIVDIAARVPGQRVGADPITRRSQAILDVLAGFGLPVRRPQPSRRSRGTFPIPLRGND